MHTKTVTFCDLQGPWNSIGLTKNVLSEGISIVGEIEDDAQVRSHAFANA